MAYFFTNASVLLAQALEMLSDVLISTFLLLSTYLSTKPADKYHMFGHGRAQNVAALISATILISFMSFETFREAIPKLLQTEQSEIQNINLAIAVIVVGMVTVSIPTLGILKTKSKESSVKTQFTALLKDEVSYIATLIAVMLVTYGYYLADPLASMFVATIIALSGIYLLKENVHYLLGKAPEENFLKKVESAAKSVKGVLGIHDLKAEYVAPNIIHADFHLEVAKGTPIEEVNLIVEEVKRKVSKETNCQHCTIHVDPKQNKE